MARELRSADRTAKGQNKMQTTTGVADDGGTNALNIAGYLPLPAGVWQGLDCLPVDLYLIEETSGRATLLRGRDYPLTSDDLDRLQQRGVSHLYVKSNEWQESLGDIQASLSACIACQDIPLKERFPLLEAVARSQLSSAYLVDMQGDQIVGQSHDLGGYVAQFCREAAVPAIEFYTVMKHDPSTFTHILNVSFYCTLLGRFMGNIDDAELEELAVGGLLHDFGKRRVARRILIKPGPLTPQEREIIMHHPELGYADLADRPGVTQRQLFMAYQHHERIDGNGYPVGLAGGEIHPWARLCSVVDVFDALTGIRPYRPRLSPPAAVNYLEQHAGTQFDAEIVQCWKQQLLMA